MIADYISDTRTILGRIDRTQITVMVGYLRRLRDRKGRLYIVRPPCPGWPAFIPVSNGGSLTTNDAALYFARDGTTLKDPVVLSIIGASDGVLARQSAASIIIPSFSTPIIWALQAVIWRGLIEELNSCGSS